VAVVASGDAVLFSETVKKVLPDKNRAVIKPHSSNRWIVVTVTEISKPDGLKILEKLKKKDKVEGNYTVKGVGLFIAVELMKK
jgi:hypothetical protein